jgi:hypothetical protein
MITQHHFSFYHLVSHHLQTTVCSLTFAHINKLLAQKILSFKNSYYVLLIISNELFCVNIFNYEILATDNKNAAFSYNR